MSVSGAKPQDTSKAHLLNLVSGKLRNGGIELPSLPDIAIDVRVAVGREDLDLQSLVKLVQQDPGLTAYLIKVSLSACYNRGHAVPNLSTAITRLGLNAARDLTMGYALKTLFQIKDPAIKNRMKECWQRSVHTAALAHVMAGRCGFNPDRALLAGLLQDIGALPLLANLKAFPDLHDSPAQIEGLINGFTGKISGLILHKWRFDNDLIVSALNRENWWHDEVAEKQLSDLVLIARYHSYLKDGRHSHLPKLCDLPAFHKLGLNEVEPQTGLGFLLEAQQEIDELRSILQH